METIVVKKDELIAVLLHNREQHRGIFEEALANYQDAVIEELEKQLDRAKQGIKRSLAVNLMCPEDHTRDYDRVIRMMEMETRDLIQLDEQQFAAFVQDDWSWRRQFLQTSNRYSPSAQAYYAQEYGGDS